MRNIIHSGLVFVFGLMVAGVGSAPAASLGTPAANAALKFDPFNPSASGAPTAGGLVSVSNQMSVAVPSVLAPAATVIKPGTILVSVADTDVQQNASSFTTAHFTVTLNKSCPIPVTVHFATSDGTATHLLDYVTTSGTLTFNPGQTSLQVPVSIRPQNATDDETFYLNLSNATVATIVRAKGACLVVGPRAPKLIVVGSTVPHGTSGVSYAPTKVFLIDGGSQTVHVTLSTSDESAIAGIDYTHVYNHTAYAVTFLPGQTSQTFTIQILGIVAAIPTRAFAVYLSNPVNAYIETSPAQMILTGHGGPTVTISSAAGTAISGAEGREFNGAVAKFTSSPSAPASNFTATILWGDGATSDGTIVSDGGGQFHAVGRHAYMEEGHYSVYVILPTSSGAANATSAATIKPSPLDQVVAANSFTVPANTTFTNRILGTFRDQDSFIDPSDYTGTISWGDKTSSACTFKSTGSTFNVGSNWQVLGTHKYASKKTYTVNVTFRDFGSGNTFPPSAFTLKITAN